MTVPIRGEAPPVDTGPPVYKILSVGVGETLDLTILDATILGVCTHWVKEEDSGRFRSVRCYNDEGVCIDCGRVARQWTGYLAVWCNKRKHKAVLAVGVKSAAALCRMGNAQFGLRGIRSLVRRSVDGKTRQLSFEVVPGGHAGPLPEAHDTSATICQLLGCKTLPDYRVGRKDLDAEGGAA